MYQTRFPFVPADSSISSSSFAQSFVSLLIGDVAVT